MAEFVPLLIGDEVEATGGEYDGRKGQVTSIEDEGQTLHVYFGTRHEQSHGGGSLVTTEAGKFSSEALLFRGYPAARSIIDTARVSDPPPSDAGLEAAALANIWDDTVRLVFADWLDEQSDPHGEYLRVQVSLGQAVRSHEPYEELADRERRLRAVLNPAWISRFRRLTTVPPPFDVSALDPEYASHVRTAVRLHPRTGDVPELAASKVGGLFLWPDEEPWPTAAGVEVDPDFGMWGPFPDDWSMVPLVPVLQLNRRDVPDLGFPSETDLLQVFWCPFTTSEHAPEPFVFWRNTTDVRSPRRQPPAQVTDGYGYIPTPCRVYPEMITEYPVHSEVQPNQVLQTAISAWSKTWSSISSGYSYWWNRCTGWKVGGYPWVNQDDCVRVELFGRHEQPLEYLLQISDRELNHTNWRWCPVEDRNLCFTGGGWSTNQLTGGLSILSRGNYHLLADRGESPWIMRSFHDSTG